MPYGVPRSDEERRERHITLYGEEPPAERIGRPGGRRGVPRTDEERMALHNLYYGPGSTPPAERYGWMGRSEHTALRESDDTLFAGASIVAWIAANKILAAIIAIAALSVAVAGLSKMQSIVEKKKREGLPLFQLVVGEPKPELIDNPKSTYTLAVVGAVPGRKTRIKFGKGKYFGTFDYVFREGYGDFVVDVTARELAEAAEKSRSLIGRLPGRHETGDVTVYMYAEEDRPGMPDLRTPIEAVRIHVPSAAENVMSAVVPGYNTPLPVTIEEANSGTAVGKKYFIKCGMPVLDMIPGAPYTPGMWIPPGFIITETP